MVDISPVCSAPHESPQTSSPRFETLTAPILSRARCPGARPAPAPETSTRAAGAFTGNGIEIRGVREPPDGAQTLARRRAGAVAIRQALLEITHARTTIKRQAFQITGSSCHRWRREGFPRAVACFSRFVQASVTTIATCSARLLVEPHVDEPFFARSGALRQSGSGPRPRSESIAATYFHLRIDTRVPSPALEEISNSCDRRFAPLRPNPIPLPVV